MVDATVIGIGKATDIYLDKQDYLYSMFTHTPTHTPTLTHTHTKINLIVR